MTNRIVLKLGRATRRRLQRTARKTRDAEFRTRVVVVLHYDAGLGCDQIAAALEIAPRTATRVARRFLEEGEEGLTDHRCENGVAKVDDDQLQAVVELVKGSPRDHGWSRPTWTRELLAKELRRMTGIKVSPTTVGRMLARLRARWGMARPTVFCPWAQGRKKRRLAAILRKIGRLGHDELAFYQDEVDIHLNPKIGRDWMLRGQQKIVVTPGQNKKWYVAGALAVGGNDLVTVGSDRKNTDLFLALLDRIKLMYPKARRIHLVLDNYVIHSSQKAQRYLEEQDGRFELPFLPPYSPNENKIERLWQDLHANVTRNHRCSSMRELKTRVRRYLAAEARRRRLREPVKPRLARGRHAA